jgi:hypothetical protein
MVCIATVAVIYITSTKIIPIAKRLQHERAQFAKEQNDLQRNPPPTEQEYDQWINEIANEVYYQIAPQKLQLPTVPKTFGDLCVNAFIRPSEKHPASPWNTAAAKRWAPGIHKPHYSINVFTRLFVMENYIAIYTDTVNVRDQKRRDEKSEHCFHQHVSYVSLEVESKQLYETATKSHFELSHQLSLALDSGYTIKLDIASARFSRHKPGFPSDPITDTDQVHKGLLEVLNDHKMSVTRSLNS